MGRIMSRSILCTTQVPVDKVEEGQGGSSSGGGYCYGPITKDMLMAGTKKIDVGTAKKLLQVKQQVIEAMENKRVYIWTSYGVFPLDCCPMGGKHNKDTFFFEPHLPVVLQSPFSTIPPSIPILGGRECQWYVRMVVGGSHHVIISRMPGMM